MRSLRLPLLAGAVLVLAACADRTPTASRAEAPPAPRAVLVDATCALGSFSSEFTPALTDADDSVSVENEFTYNCTVGASIGSSADAFVNPSLSCVNLLEAAPARAEVITWTGGSGAQTSTINYTAVQSTTLATTFTGTVTAGRFQGDLVVKVLAGVGYQGSNPTLCPLGMGTVSRASGTATLTITDTSV